MNDKGYLFKSSKYVSTKVDVPKTDFGYRKY
jgi:hypothetical protein